MLCSREMSESSDTVRAIAEQSKSPQVSHIYPSHVMPSATEHAWGAEFLICETCEWCHVTYIRDRHAKRCCLHLCACCVPQTSGEVSWSPSQRTAEANCSTAGASPQVSVNKDHQQQQQQQQRCQQKEQQPVLLALPDPPVALTQPNGLTGSQQAPVSPAWSTAGLLDCILRVAAPTSIVDGRQPVPCSLLVLFLHVCFGWTVAAASGSRAFAAASGK